MAALRLSDLELSPSDSHRSPTDDTLAKAVAVDSLWTYRLVGRELLPEDEVSIVRHLVTHLDYRAAEITDVKASRTFFEDVFSILSRNDLLEALTLCRVKVSEPKKENEEGLVLRLSKFQNLSRLEILRCDLTFLKIPKGLTSLSLDRSKVSSQVLEAVAELPNLLSLAMTDIEVHHMRPDDTASLLANTVAEIIDRCSEIQRIATGISTEQADLESKKKLLKSIARNCSLQFIGFKPHAVAQKLKLTSASKRKTSPGKIGKTLPEDEEQLGSNVADDRLTKLKEPQFIIHKSANRMGNMQQPGKEDFHWSLGKSKSIDLDELQVKKIALTPPNDLDSYSQSDEGSEDEGAFIEDFVSCNLKANRFIAREGTENLRLLIEEGGLEAKLANYQMPDVMHRLVCEKVGMSPSATKRNTCNEEFELNAAKDSARNSDGRIERELNLAVRKVDMTKIRIPSSTKKTKTEREEESTMKGQFVLHSMTPKDTAELKEALQLEINNPCSISDRHKKVNVAGFLLKNPKKLKKESNHGPKKGNPSTSKSIHHKRRNTEILLPSTRRKSVEEPSVLRFKPAKLDVKGMVPKLKKISELVKKQEKQKKKLVSKEGKESNDMKTRRPSTSKPALKPMKGVIKAKPAKEKTACHTERAKSHKKTAREHNEKQHHNNHEKENLHVMVNLDTPAVYKEFTFKVPDKDPKVEEFKLHHLKNQHVFLTADKNMPRTKSAKIKKKTTKAIR